MKTFLLIDQGKGFENDTPVLKGQNVLIANDCFTALGIMAGEKIDGIVCSFRLSDLSYPERACFHKIREISSGIPLLFLSGESPAEGTAPDGSEDVLQAAKDLLSSYQEVC